MKIIPLLFTVGLAPLAAPATAQFTGWDWVEPFQGVSVNHIATDEGGFTYAAHRFYDPVSFGGITWQEGQSALAKYDTDGTVLWAIPLYGASFDRVCVKNDTVYAVGIGQGGSGTFGIGTQTWNTFDPAHALILAAFQSDGTSAWTRIDTLQGNTKIWDIEVNSTGRVFLSGMHQGTLLWDGDTITGTASPAVFVYGAGGTHLWFALADVDETEKGFALGVAGLDDGSAVVCGTFSGGTLRFDSLERTASPYFLARLDNQGAWVWAKDGTGATPWDVDSTTGDSLYVAGDFADGTDAFGPILQSTGHDLFVTKVGADGGYGWLHRSSSSAPVLFQSEQLCVDPQGRAVVAVSAYGGVIAGDTLPPHSLYVEKIDGSGQHMASAVMYMEVPISGGIGTRGVGADEAGHCYVGGFFVGGDLQFDNTSIASPPVGTSKLIVARTNLQVVGITEHMDHAPGIYPNPSTGVFHIEGLRPQAVTVVDVEGRLVAPQFIASGIDLSHLADGVYVLRIASAKRSSARRLVLMR